MAWPADPFTRLSSARDHNGASGDPVREHVDVAVVGAAHVLR